MFPRSHLWLNESDRELVSLLRLSQAIDIYWCPFTFLTFWVGGNRISRLTLSFFIAAAHLKQLREPLSIFQCSIYGAGAALMFSLEVLSQRFLFFLFHIFDSYILTVSLTLCVSDSPFHFSIFFL